MRNWGKLDWFVWNAATKKLTNPEALHEMVWRFFFILWIAWHVASWLKHFTSHSCWHWAMKKSCSTVLYHTCIPLSFKWLELEKKWMDGWLNPRFRGFVGNNQISFPACAFLFFFFFEVEITSRTLIPLFRPGSVHSGSASWDDCDRVFLEELCVS